jgi:DnaJ homolog subfamily A member 5
VYRRLFQRLEEEEEEAWRNDPSEELESFTPYPAFGNSKMPVLPTETSPDCARDFYNSWSNFSTAKSFRWFDKWRLSEAPNRRVKRVMETENKKLRNAARKEYNDTVRVSDREVKKGLRIC